jgi:hypothetical protein
MIAKLGVKGYAGDVSVIDLVALKLDKIISIISITVYTLPETHKDERKLTKLPTPTMPNDTIMRPWITVNNLARSSKALAAPVTPPAPVPMPTPHRNAGKSTIPTPVPAHTPPIPASSSATVTATQQLTIPLGTPNLEAPPKNMTIEQLIQIQKAASTPFTTVNVTPVLYLLPSP